MTRGTFYPVTLDGNVNPWNNMNVIVESTPELCGHEDQLEEVEGHVEEIKNALLTKTLLMTLKKLFLLLKQVLSNFFGHVVVNRSTKAVFRDKRVL